MKIMIIVPGHSWMPEAIKARERYYRALCSPETDLKVVLGELPILLEGQPSTSGVSYIDEPLTAGLIAHGILKKVQQAIKDDFDGILIHCGGDFAVTEARNMADIPVFGGMEASVHIASMLADRFGIITSLQRFVPMKERLVKLYGVSDRVVSVKAVDMHYDEHLQTKKELEKKFIEVAREQIEQGAQLIVPAELLILVALGLGAADRLSQKLGIQVLDSNAVTFKFLEMLANLKVRYSKEAFPSPNR